jgi:hypothetical protein
MTASLSTIGPRLAKLLPLLGSDQPGEVVATARAIGQTLKSGLCCSIIRSNAALHFVFPEIETPSTELWQTVHQ